MCTNQATQVYIAHPIGDDVEANLRKVERLALEVMLSIRYAPVVPYLTALRCLDDAKPEHRTLGIEMNRDYFRRHFIDEVWLCGAVTEGVGIELQWAKRYGIPVIDKRDWADTVLGSEEK